MHRAGKCNQYFKRLPRLNVQSRHCFPTRSAKRMPQPV